MRYAPLRYTKIGLIVVLVLAATALPRPAGGNEAAWNITGAGATTLLQSFLN